MEQVVTEIVMYKSIDGQVKVEVLFEQQTAWLTIDQMAALFGKSRSTINEHILNVYREKELEQEHTMRKIGNSDFSSKSTNYYNLDVIISVGYRVKSQQGTQFRIWATARLKEYIIKGFSIDDDRLKNLGTGGYWRELIERIRDIRASEKVFYRQVLDIYSTSIDYDPKAEITIDFFKRVQNKIHYAIHEQTASELIYNRVDSEKEFLGLTTFKGTRPHLSDAVIAKNYLSEKELRSLGQLVSGYLDFAERQAERQIPMTMKDWDNHLNNILTMSGEKLLSGAGSISHEQAVDKVKVEYRKYQNKTLSQVEEDYLFSIKQIAENKK